MKNLIISPHTDDAIFSMASFIEVMDNVTILSPFAGIPDDPAGKQKHTVLREEHRKACEFLGVEFINGDFLDDVYEPTNEHTLIFWLRQYLINFDRVFVPLGIFHPDHIYIRKIFRDNFPFYAYYSELPYRIAFPELSENVVKAFCTGLKKEICQPTDKKLEVCALYESQTKGLVLEQTMNEERIYIR